MRAHLVVGGVMLGLIVAGCSDSSASEPPAVRASTSVSTPASSESAVPTETPTGDPTATDVPTETPTDVPTETIADPPSEQPPDTGDGQSPVPLPPDATNRPLTLSSIFKVPYGWHDGRFDVADRKQASGIGGELNACGDDQAQVLELRLANNFSQLKLDFGQSNASESSDQVMQVRIDANGQYRDSRTVRQNQIASMTIPVAKVNALKIIVTLKEGDGCSTGTVQAVLMNLILT